MSAALKLEIYQNGELLQEVPCDNQELWIGRDDDCVIRLEDRAISRRHGSIKATDQGVDFEKKSKFGNARVNGKDVEQAALKGGDRLEMGPYEIRVVALAPPPPPPPAPAPVENRVAPVTAIRQELSQITTPALPEAEIHTTAAEPSMNMGFGGEQPDGVESMNFGNVETPSDENHSGENHDAPHGEGQPVHSGAFDFAHVETDGATRVFEKAHTENMKAVLQFGDGAANVTQYEITDDEVAIGRSQKCHVVLEDKRSSRKHSVIRREGKKYFVKDQGSANGTLVNGEKVDDQELHSGDILQIGDTQFTFQMMQADYDQKKDQFIQVAHEEHAAPVDAHPVEQMQMQMPQMMPMDMAQQFQAQAYANPNMGMGAAPAQAAPDFAAPSAANKSFIGKYLDRYRAMNTKQQIIYGAVILGVIWMMLDDDTPAKKPHMNMGQTKAQVKKVDKKPGVGVSFESLTPEQQRYIETEYNLCFDFYKNRDYDSALLEVGKIFSLVQDYKNAREIETFAREGKRKLEAQEEERKKKEVERQAQIKLQSLLEQAGMLMDKKRFSEAEALFPEIELLQPENAAVGTWRKQMMAEKELLEQEAQSKRQQAAINKAAWDDFEKAKQLAKDKKYWDALDAYDELAGRTLTDQKFVPAVKDETKRVEDLIAGERDPLYAQGKQLESDGKGPEAYKLYQKVLEIDPLYKEATEGMTRIRGNITGRAKVLYSEGVFAESFSDVDTAEKRYREVMEQLPNDDPYYIKAQSRLRKLMVFKEPVPPVSSTGSGSGSDTPQQ